MLITKTIQVLVAVGTLNYYRSKGVVCNFGDKINFNIYLKNIKEQNASI